ncbi:glucosamine-6-phosphate deaminase [Yersinia similis]|uniref:glucosamine-6-phosphate deaminase n=1 Tax=Yersinia similis TaxID=367190 RepID=UPI001643C445|nr:glucosamine-6-phosphate deaminase [Yersinia similis]
MIKVEILADKQSLGVAAAEMGATILRTALSQQPEVTIIVATGASQFEMLDHLVGIRDIDWSRVRVFHLDEYVGLAPKHRASFRGYLQQRLIDRLSVPLLEFIAVNGSAGDLQAELSRLSQCIRQHPVDLCFGGIGENAHLAFNDPPADVETEQPYLLVKLDQGCRQQQLGEGWFDSIDEVPQQAISMSIRQIIKSKKIILSVPDTRKADAVQAVLEQPVSNMIPASILQQHPDCTIFLDQQSAAKLQPH